MTGVSPRIEGPAAEHDAEPVATGIDRARNCGLDPGDVGACAFCVFLCVLAGVDQHPFVVVMGAFESSQPCDLALQRRVLE